MEQLALKITGVSAVLMHSTRGMSRTDSDGVRSRTIPTPEEEARLGEYRDADGDLALPTVGFRSGALFAASGLKVGRLTAKRALGGFFPLDEFVKLVDPDTGDQITDYEIDVRPARIGTARIMRARPKIDKWACTLNCEFDSTLIDKQSILELLNKAGRMAGIGDYRVQTAGVFGRYAVEEA